MKAWFFFGTSVLIPIFAVVTVFFPNTWPMLSLSQIHRFLLDSALLVPFAVFYILHYLQHQQLVSRNANWPKGSWSKRLGFVSWGGIAWMPIWVTALILVLVFPASAPPLMVRMYFYVFFALMYYLFARLLHLHYRAFERLERRERNSL